jgi:nicotinamide phosphoribosyltransferase
MSMRVGELGIMFNGITRALQEKNMKNRSFLPATVLCDFYKISHRAQYPSNTQLVYSTWTPRASRVNGISEVVAFGFQAFIQKYLIDFFDDNFFNRPKEDVVAEYKRVIKYTLGDQNPDASHLEALHDLGYLPLKIKAVDEGTLVPIRVPMLTIQNTDPRFFWLTNYIESLASCELWQPSTSATLAHRYRAGMDKDAAETGGPADFVQFQGHDFSMRGMGCLEASMLSGAGHLLSFTGTDTIPAILFLEKYYGANIETELVGTSIPATEHSVMCAYGSTDEEEFEAYRHIITEVYPNGFVSIVSDTRDLWYVINTIIRRLKPDILARKGGPVGDKVVVRPDSGDPVLIVCGDPKAHPNSPEYKGVVELLWDIFGGTVNAKGFKELDSHIGCIYGDAITIDRRNQIAARLKAKGFASTNCVFGIGSYTYQFNTRDTFGFALKSTAIVRNGEEKMIFKNPKTDDGVKKSQKGAVSVYIDSVDGKMKVKDQQTLLAVNSLKDEDDLLKTIFLDGKLTRVQTLAQIRAKLATSR